MTDRGKTVVDTSAMSEERFKSLASAYGGDPARWPADEREAALRLLQANSAARTALEEARNLDAVLLLAGVAAPSMALTNRLLADFERTSRRWSPRKFAVGLADAVWPGAPLWQPVTALGLALVIGIGLAALAPLDSRQNDDAIGGAFALDVLPDADVGQDI